METLKRSIVKKHTAYITFVSRQPKIAVNALIAVECGKWSIWSVKLSIDQTFLASELELIWKATSRRTKNRESGQIRGKMTVTTNPVAFTSLTLTYWRRPKKKWVEMEWQNDLQRVVMLSAGNILFTFYVFLLSLASQRCVTDTTRA